MALNFVPSLDWVSWQNDGAAIAAFDIDGDGITELIQLRIDRPNTGPNRGYYRLDRGFAPSGAVAGWGTWIEIPGWTAEQNAAGGIAVARFGAGDLGLVVFQIEVRVPGPNIGRFSVGHPLAADGTVGAWSAWQEVPNWISWRDQGGAIAVADLDNDGQPELLVMHIDDAHTDAPTQPNRGFYRVGTRLGSDGSVGAWGDWTGIDWFSWFNQGAGLAIGDLDGDGHPDLVVFQIDAPLTGDKFGFCRVGWNLDASGTPQDGWGLGCGRKVGGQQIT